jgi:hypothetical protein
LWLLLLLWRRCKAEQSTQRCYRKDEEKNHFIRRTTRVLCQNTHSQALTRHSDLFCQHPGLVVRLPQPLSAGVAAQTLLTYVFLLLTQHLLRILQCTVRSLGEWHHEALAHISILGVNQTHLHTLCVSSYHLLHAEVSSYTIDPLKHRLPSKVTIPFRKLSSTMPRQRQRGHCDFLSETPHYF